jgi:hypothetical protein
LTVSSVRVKDGGFVAKQIVDANEITPGSAGQSLLVWWINTHGRFVSSIRGTAYGLLQNLVVVHQSNFKTVTVKSIRLGSSTYSKFGQVPDISAPPKRKTVILVPCKNGDTSDIDGNVYMCGTFGT